MVLEKNNLAPFNGVKLEKIKSRSEELSEYRGNSNKIIREEWHDWKDKENMIEKINKRKEMLNELKNDYGLNIPATEFIAGEKEKGYTKIFQVTDKVEGMELNKYEHKEKDNSFVARESEKIIVSIIKYLKDKTGKKEDFMLDIFKPENYMYGKTAEEEISKIYFTDLANVVAYKRKDTGKKLRYAADLYSCVREIMEFIGSLEKTTGKLFTAPRKKIKELYEYLNNFEIDDKNKNRAKIETMWQKNAP